MLCAGFTEPRGGSDLQGLRLRAERDGDGWRLSGEKTSVTTSPHSDAAIILATVDPSRGARGTIILLVDMDDPTISLQKFRDPGFRPQGRAGVTFDATFVPRSRQMGEIGEGFRQIMREFELSRTLLGLMCAGTARRAMEMTVDWVRQREAFGQTIADFQGIQWKIAELAAEIEAARLLTYRAAWMADRSQFTKEYVPFLSMAKYYATELAVKVSGEALRMLGAAGYMEDHPTELYYRDAKQLTIVEGTTQVQLGLIARGVLDHDLWWD